MILTIDVHFILCMLNGLRMWFSKFFNFLNSVVYQEGAVEILLKIDRITNTESYKPQIMNLIKYAYIIYFPLYYVLVILVKYREKVQC